MSAKHNILFYSNHPGDQLSKQILQELNLNPLLKEQYLTVCVNSPNIKLPRMILEKNEVPVIVTRGFDRPISGESALSLIREANSGKAGGLDYGNPEKASQVSEDHGVLAAESGRTSYQQAFNEDWNQGSDVDSRTVNSAFSPIEDGFQQNAVDTYEERGKGTKGLKTQLDRKLKQMNFQRMKEVPPPVQRIGGHGDLNGMPLNASRQQQPPGGMGGFMNPQQQNPFAPNNFPQTRMGLGGGGGSPQMGGRGDMRFPPPPSQNPLFPPPRAPMGGNGNGNVPQLPPGFGQQTGGGGDGIRANSRSSAASMGGSDFSSFDSAFSGAGLMGTPMETSRFSGRQQSNPKREKMLSMGLPSGRGHAGPYSSMMNTSNF